MSGKDTGRVWRSPCAEFLLLFLFLLRGRNSTHSSPSNKNAATVGYVSDQGIPLDLAFKILLGAGHIGTLCLLHTKISDSQKESRSSLNHIFCICSLGTVNYPYAKECGNTSKVPITSQELSLQVDPSKDNSLFLHVFLCTYANIFKSRLALWSDGSYSSIDVYWIKLHSAYGKIHVSN